MVDARFATAENRRGKRRKKLVTTSAKYNGLPVLLLPAALREAQPAGI